MDTPTEPISPSPPATTFVVEIDLTYDELVEGVLWPGRIKRRLIRAGMILLGLAAMAAPLRFPSMRDGSTHVAVLSGFFLVATAALGGWQNRDTLRKVHKRDWADQPATVTIADDHVLTRSPTQVTRTSWHGFTHVTRTPRLFLLFLKGERFIPIPKRAAGDAAGQAALWAFVLDRVGRTTEQPVRGFPVTTR
jgi:hypothetical protein